MLLGRDAEVARLGDLLARCRAGNGGTVLVHGEPGIGKTAVATEVARLAASSGARVYWGRCQEEGGSPPHWPWVQVLRALAFETEPARLASASGGGLAYLRAAVPEISERLLDAEHAAAGEPPPNRFAFFDAVETLLRGLAEDSPIVLVLDDLHAADASSLALCDFLAPGLAESRVLVVATYREREAETGESAAAIASIARHADRIRLAGLGREALAALVAAVSGRAVPARLATAIHETTEGNPLFASEIARSLGAETEGTGRVPVPPTVEHVLAARLAPISSAARQTLAEAAVVGRDFDVAMVHAITQKEATEIHAHLDEAIRAGVVRMALGLRGGAAFAHAVYREFFYGGLSPLRRAELHRDAARALAARDLGDDAAAIVFHLFEAGSLGDAAKAAEFAERAGRRALERFAFADAAGHFEDALRALGPAADHLRRCDLLLRLAEARFRAGAGEACKQAYREAGAIALDRRDGARLARVALGLAGPWSFIGGALRKEVVDFLNAALEHLGAGTEALRSRVLAALSLEICFVGDLAHPDAMGRRAIELARSAADERALVEALLARRMSMPVGARTLGERLDLTAEAFFLADKLHDPELAFRASFCRIWDSLQLGDAHAFERDVAAAARIAASLRQPFYRWFVQVWHAAKALVDGRLSDAERLVDEAFQVGQQAQGDDEAQQFAVQIYQAQLYFVRREQGTRLAELEPAVRAVATTVPIPLIRCFLADLHGEIGRPDEARAGLEALAADDFAAIREDVLWPICMTTLAGIAADLGDRDRARVLYDRLLPFAAEHVSQGAYYNGAVSYYLGRLAGTLGRVADAKRHLDVALREHRRMGARCWIARTELHTAALLLRARRTAARGRRLAERARDEARGLGMAKLAADADRLLASQS